MKELERSADDLPALATDLSEKWAAFREQEAQRRKNRPYFTWGESEAKALKARRLIAEMVPLIVEAKLDDEHREFLEDDLTKIEQAVRDVRDALEENR